ncbi:MAG: head-tail adaptor protein [Chloroflexota bacterium]
MIGPKTSVTLQRRVVTQAGTGAKSETWRDLLTVFAVLSPKRVSETTVYDKQTVFADYELRIEYTAIKREFRADLNEKNRLKTSADTFKIVGVRNFYNRFYVLELLRDPAA